MSTKPSIAARFWLCMMLPAAVLALFTVLLVTVGGRGREFVPFVVLLLGLVAVPAAALINGWVLFVRWQLGSLLVSAFVLPTLIGAVMAIYLESTPGQRAAFEAWLAPPFALLGGGLASPASRPCGLGVSAGGVGVAGAAAAGVAVKRVAF